MLVFSAALLVLMLECWCVVQFLDLQSLSGIGGGMAFAGAGLRILGLVLILAAIFSLLLGVMVFQVDVFSGLILRISKSCGTVVLGFAINGLLVVLAILR